jgi:CheY-like chemotaxis protein
MPAAKILVVDDDPDFVEITRIVLESKGYSVISASNGREAMACVRAEHPDLVVLDVMMSSILDGLDVTQQLASDPQTEFMPIIMVSSIADTPYAGLFPVEEQPHMDAWMSKPIDPKALLAKVDELLV